MSNPLIRPNDPRFQRPALTDAEGKNRFSEENAPPQVPGDVAESVYAAPQSPGERSYQPEYVTGQPSRQHWILLLGGGAVAALAAAIVAVWLGHWTAYLLLIVEVPLALVGCYLATDDLSAIRRGGLDVSYRATTRWGLLLNALMIPLAIALLAFIVRSGLGFAD
jgi:hypothetical protein